MVWLPIVGYGILTAASVGGTYWGYRVIQQHQETTQERIERLRAEREGQQVEQVAQMQALIQRLNPLMIAGTIAMTGIGAFVMLRGRRDQRRRSRQEIVGVY